jgi:acid stress-induced BolA-like protein IbaG/YrbA
MRAIYPCHLIILDFIIIFSKNINFEASHYSVLFQPPIISFLFGSNIPKRDENTKQQIIYGSYYACMQNINIHTMNVRTTRYAAG